MNKGIDLEIKFLVSLYPSLSDEEKNDLARLYAQNPDKVSDCGACLVQQIPDFSKRIHNFNPDFPY